MQTPRSFEPLPFDDGADRPVDVVLTARARRVVAPTDLPDLRVVDDGPVETPDPSDTRPSRARALRRAGRSVASIAQALQVDELLVRAWVADVRGGRSRRGSAATSTDGGPTSIPRNAAASARSSQAPTEEVDEHRLAFELARADARDEARRTRLADPDFAAGLGVLVGLAEVDVHAVMITAADTRLVRFALDWLREHADLDPHRVRLVLRIGAAVAGDLAAHRWARELGLPKEGIAIASWRKAPRDDDEQALLRIADPTLSAAIAGWRDALLTPGGEDDADIAF